MTICRRRIARVSGTFFAFLVFFQLSLPVHAAEGAAADPNAAFAGTLFRWLNFAIVFGAFAYLIKKGDGFFRSNAKAISAGIQEGTAAKEEANRHLQEVETKIARLDQEVGELREAARRDFAVETERMNAAGAAEIEKIHAAARAELGATERAAKQELRALAAAMAVERAGEVVASRMDKNLRAKLMRTFLAELGRSAN